ncbi:MAG: S8 family serine peptidase [Anaerolineae bacterium]
MNKSAWGRALRVVLFVLFAGAVIWSARQFSAESQGPRGLEALQLRALRDLLLPASPRRPPDRYDRPIQGVGDAGGTSGVEPVVTEALERSGAGEYHAWGYDGSGVKVAVIDEGFHGLDALIRRGELPADVVTRRFTREGGVTETLSDVTSAHGAACAEIIHDLAPGARLYLVEVEDLSANFSAIFDYLAREQVQIVSLSMALAPRHRGDGNGALGNPPVPIYALLDEVRDERGILVVKSSGNHAQRHYAGVFSDANGNGRHEFGVTREGWLDETLEINAPSGQRLEFFLIWDAWDDEGHSPPKGGYELVLFDAQGREVARSVPDQPERGTPVEILDVTPPTDGPYALRIQQRGDFASSHHLRLFARWGVTTFDRYQVSQGSLSPPADAAGVLAVGAARIYDGKLAPYSARGPTADGRIKPDLTGYAEVSVASPFYKRRFSGTSAAAPYVVGLAALLLDYAATPLSPDEIAARLLEAAVDRGAPGKDVYWGAGLAQLPPLDPHVRIVKPAPVQAASTAGRLYFRVTVHRSDGSYIAGLTASAFQATLDGERLDLLTVRDLGDGYLLETGPTTPVEAGMHTLTVRAFDAVDTAVFDLDRPLTAEMAPRLDLRMTPSDDLRVGDLIHLQASLTAQQPLTGAWVRAVVRRPQREGEGSAEDTLTLFDDGLHGDGLGADGVYGARYRRLTEPGRYRLTVLASHGDLELRVGLTLDVAGSLYPPGDDLPDRWKAAVGVGAGEAYLDLDGDGLTNREEYLSGADPHDCDTDGDGLTDGEEVGGYYATDPANPDTDLGGRSDAEELWRWTQPLDPTDDGRARRLWLLSQPLRLRVPLTPAP